MKAQETNDAELLALVIKTYIEAGNRYSQLAHVWAKIEAKA